MTGWWLTTVPPAGPRLIVTVSCWSFMYSSDRSFSTIRRTSSLSLRISIMSEVQSGRGLERRPREVLGKRAQVFGTVLRDEEVIFDPNSADAGQINPGLDRDDIAGLKSVGGELWIRARFFVSFQPHAMAQAVPEVLPVALPADVGP